MVAKADTLTLRPISVEDAEAAARLSAELGYPVPGKEMAERIRAQQALPDAVIYVACMPEEGVVGWIDVHITHHLQAAPRAEIGGLVVANGVRGRGIGRRLVTQAEHWAADRGMTQMVV